MFLGRLFALLAALASSCTPVFAQALSAAGWTPWQVSAARSTIGCLALALFLGRDLRQARHDPIGMLGMVFVMLVGTTTYLYAVTHASMGTAVCVVYLGTLWVTLYQRWRGTPEAFDVAASGVMLVGIALVVGFGGPEDTWQGIASAAVSSVMYAGVTLLGSRVTRTVLPSVVACVSMVGGALAFGWMLPSASWSPVAAFSAVGIGLVSGALMFVASNVAYKRIGTETRMWFPFEIPIVCAAQAAKTGHVPSAMSLAGTALIFFAAFLLAYGKHRLAAVTAQPSS